MAKQTIQILSGARSDRWTQERRTIKAKLYSWCQEDCEKLHVEVEAGVCRT
jgi:hypothetical protein